MSKLSNSKNVTIVNSSAHNIETKLEVPVYPKRNVTIVRGSGAILYDEADREYIDLVSGIGVASIGHSHPKLQEALSKQLETLITCPEIFSNPVRADLIERLVSITPPSLDQVYLGNSGTESIEAALKFARTSTGKSGVIAAMRGFHGRTMGSLSVTFNQKYRKPFEPLVPHIEFVPFNNIQRLKDTISEDTGAIILELIQGNGGLHIIDLDYLRNVRELCDAKGIILIFDEVQTGIARTGKMFAFEHFNVLPDILCLAKALGGGLPISATIIASSKISIGRSLHGSTFGGNPLACQAALFTLDIVEDEDLISLSREKGAYLMQKLGEIGSPLIKDIRGKGLMIGIELRVRVYEIIMNLQNEGILVGPAGSTVIRLLPPLVISYDELDRFIDAFTLILSNYE